LGWFIREVQQVFAKGQRFGNPWQAPAASRLQGLVAAS